MRLNTPTECLRCRSQRRRFLCDCSLCFRLYFQVGWGFSLNLKRHDTILQFHLKIYGWPWWCDLSPTSFAPVCFLGLIYRCIYVYLQQDLSVCQLRSTWTHHLSVFEPWARRRWSAFPPRRTEILFPTSVLDDAVCCLELYSVKDIPQSEAEQCTSQKSGHTFSFTSNECVYVITVLVILPTQQYVLM